MARTDSANGFGTWHVYAEVDPKTNDAHYRVELLVGIRVRGRPGYPIKGAYGLGHAELRSGALAPKGVSRFPRYTYCARLSSGVCGLFDCPFVSLERRWFFCAGLGPVRPS